MRSSEGAIQLVSCQLLLVFEMEKEHVVNGWNVLLLLAITLARESANVNRWKGLWAFPCLLLLIMPFLLFQYIIQKAKIAIMQPEQRTTTNYYEENIFPFCSSS